MEGDDSEESGYDEQGNQPGLTIGPFDHAKMCPSLRAKAMLSNMVDVRTDAVLFPGRLSLP
ncbi:MULTISPECIES: hypothetical protein [unclassified Sinorhizobium]|uniref:hypothetical protein n=1 Tax=unclassified Sinorhizobium TaxID=2613772 RepID=UPI0035267E34